MSENCHAGHHWYANGQSGLKEDLLNLFLSLDRHFQEIASRFHGKEHRFPIFVPVAEMQKIDYLGSFPHLATFPVTLRDDQKNLESFVTRGPIGPQGGVQLTEVSPIRDMLTPAACYHFYIQYQKQELAAPLFLTTVANCFRRESHFVPLERQWNFNMREIVCIGTAEEVQEFLSACRREVEGFLVELGLPIEWQVATDPFFNPAKNPKFLLQRLQPNKTEMVFQGRLAIGSVNFHRNYFGEAFAIRRENQEAYSGCVAFGVERWVSAILHHFGPKRENWPALLREIP